MVDWAVNLVEQDLDSMNASIMERDEHAAKADYTGDTNLPSSVLRYNRTTKHWEEWDGAAWNTLDFHDALEEHIADNSIHGNPGPGELASVAYEINGNPPDASKPPPDGWLFCNGDAVSRTTYSALFAKIQTLHGIGDGSTTFNVPDFRGRIPIGLSGAITAIDTVGEKTGSWDHLHSGPSHNHSLPAHAHGVSHTHPLPAHSHPLDDHQHNSQPHSHGATGNGADINIASSGVHNHGAAQSQVGSFTNDPSNPASGIVGHVQGGTAATSAPLTSSQGHPHANSDFAGRVGNVNSGNNGDGTVATSGVIGGAGSTQSGGSGTSGASSISSTDSGGSGSTGDGGTGNTGPGNPPVLVVNWIIRYR